jgi:hypothetical protein
LVTDKMIELLQDVHAFDLNALYAPES